MFRKKNVTRNDVAKMAGVSPAVVSYVINGTKFVSEERRAAVEEAIKKLNYHPNMMARGLKTQKSMLIAFVCDNLRSTWLEQAEEQLFEKGYYVSHCYSKPGQEFLNSLVLRRFDGIFMMTNQFTTGELNWLAAQEIPILLYKTRSYGELDPRIVTLVPDYTDAVGKAVHYLVSKGHTRIAMFPPIKYKTKGLGGDDFRVHAYEEAMKMHKLFPSPEYVCTKTEKLETIKEHVFSLMVCKPEEERPTAMVVGDDYLAAQIMNYLKELGIRVPADVAVIGADNSYIASLVSPALTTADFSKTEFSNKLVEMMTSMIDGISVDDCILDMNIIIRESA